MLDNLSLLSSAESLFNSRNWIETLCITFDLDPILLQGENTVIPIAKFDNLHGTRLIGFPYTGCISLNGNIEAWAVALSKLIDLYPDYKIALRFTSQTPPKEYLEGWNVECMGITYRVETNCNKANILSRFSQPFAHQARQAKRSGVTTIVTRELKNLQQFYNLYVNQRRKKFLLLSPPIKYFEKIHERWFNNESGFLMEAYVEGKLASGIVIVEYNNVWYNLFSASDPQYLKARPNNLLFEDLLFLANEKKIIGVDLGMCWLNEGDEGLRKFKQGMGGVGEFIYSSTYFPENYNYLREEEARNLFKHLTSQLVKIDLSELEISNLGEILFKYFN